MQKERFENFVAKLPQSQDKAIQQLSDLLYIDDTLHNDVFKYQELVDQAKNKEENLAFGHFTIPELKRFKSNQEISQKVRTSELIGLDRD